MLVELPEQVAIGRLGGAQKQKAARAQGKMKRFNQPILRRLVQVDEEVAARNQIEMGERRVADDIVAREEDHFAQFTTHAMPTALVLEEPLQPLGIDIR